MVDTTMALPAAADIEADSPKCAPSSLKRAEQTFTAWRHVLPYDVDWREAFATRYWANVLGKLTPGDRIAVTTPDFKIQYEFAVIEVVDLASFLRLAARPLYPHDLVLPPITETVERPRYGAVPDQKTGGGTFVVMDLKTGHAIASGLYRPAANEIAQSRNEAAHAAGEFVPADAEAVAATAGRRARR